MGAENYLAALTELRRGTSLTDAVTVERLEAIQYLLRALWRGDNVQISGFSKSGIAGSGVNFRPGKSRSVAVAASECQLGNLSVDTVNSTEVLTKYKIESGYVHGGGTSVLLEKDDITPVIGEKLYIKMDWTAQTTNGVLLVTGAMTGQSIEQGVSVPADDVITVSSLSGSHYRLLGEWIDDGDGNPQWVNDSCGAYTFSFCNGIFTGYRGNPTIMEPYYYYY